MNNLECTYEQHMKKPIIKLCLNQDCKFLRKVCQYCLITNHQNHVSDCFNFPFLAKILVNEHKKLSSFYKLIVNVQTNLHLQCQNIIKKVKDYLNVFEQQFSYFCQNPDANLNSLISFILKCYNQYLSEEILNIILEDTLAQDRANDYQQMKTIFFNIYGEDDQNFILEKIEEKGDNLVDSDINDEAVKIFGYLGQYEKLYENKSPSMKKWFLLMINQKRSEAFQYYQNQFPETATSEFRQNTISQMVDYFKGNSTQKSNQQMLPIISYYTNVICGRQLSEMVFPHWMLWAQFYLSGSQQNYGESLQYLNQIINLDQQNDYAIYLKVQILFLMDLYEEAHKFCDEGLLKFSENQAYFLGKWECLIRYKEKEKTDAFQKIESNHPYLPFMRGLLLIQENQYDLAIQQLDLIKPDNTCYQNAQFFKGTALIHLNKKQECHNLWVNLDFTQPTIYQQFHLIQKEINFYRLIRIVNNPTELLRFFEYGVLDIASTKCFFLVKCEILREQEKYDEALQYYNLGLSHFPNSVILIYFQCEFFYILVITLIAMKQYQQALDNVEQLIGRNFFRQQNIKIKGQLLFRLQQMPKSLEIFKYYTHQFSQDLEGLLCQGYVLIKQRYFDNALDCFMQIQKQNSQHVSSIYGSALAYVGQRKYTEAIPYYQTIPKYKKSSIYLIMCLITLGDYTEALVQLDQFENSNYKYNLFRQKLKCFVLFKLKRFNEAYDNFQFTCLKKFKQCNFWHYTMTLIKVQKYIEAQETISQASKGVFIDQMLLGYLLEIQNEDEKALEQYQYALSQIHLPLIIKQKIILLHKMQKINEAEQLEEEFTQQFPNYQHEINFEEGLFQLIVVSTKFEFKLDDPNFFEFVMKNDISKLYLLSEVTLQPTSILY